MSRADAFLLTFMLLQSDQHWNRSQRKLNNGEKGSIRSEHQLLSLSMSRKITPKHRSKRSTIPRLPVNASLTDWEESYGSLPSLGFKRDDKVPDEFKSNRTGRQSSLGVSGGGARTAGLNQSPAFRPSHNWTFEKAMEELDKLEPQPPANWTYEEALRQLDELSPQPPDNWTMQDALEALSKAQPPPGASGRVQEDTELWAPSPRQQSDNSSSQELDWLGGSSTVALHDAEQQATAMTEKSAESDIKKPVSFTPTQEGDALAPQEEDELANDHQGHEQGVEEDSQAENEDSQAEPQLPLLLAEDDTPGFSSLMSLSDLEKKRRLLIGELRQLFSESNSTDFTDSAWSASWSLVKQVDQTSRLLWDQIAFATEKFYSRGIKTVGRLLKMILSQGLQV